MNNVKKCHKHVCGYWDDENEKCTCLSGDMKYACPIERKNGISDENLKKWCDCIFAYDDLKCRFCGFANCGKCKYHITKNTIVDYLCNVSNDNLLPLQVINDLIKLSNK